MHRLNDKSIKILRSNESATGSDLPIKDNSLAKWLAALHPPRLKKIIPPTDTDVSAAADSHVVENNEVLLEADPNDHHAYQENRTTAEAYTIQWPEPATIHAVEPLSPSLALPPTSFTRLIQLIKNFCSNRAVEEAGPWTMNIPIDPDLLPGTTLSMSVSHFELALRFTLTDPKTKDRICLHQQTLQESLTPLVAPRQVEIVVF